MKRTLLTLCALCCGAAAVTATEYNVLECGFTADGKTDNTQAMNSLLARVAPGDAIRFPAGIYFFGSDIKLEGSDLTLDGNGTILFEHKDNDPAYNDNRKISIKGKNITVRNLKITSRAQTRSAVYGLISCEGAENILIDGVEIFRGPSTAVWTMDSANIRIVNCNVHHQWADGIHISRNSRNVLIADNIIDFNGDDGIGVVSYHGAEPWNQLPRNENVLITGNSISNTPARGICASGGGITITGNQIFNTGKAGIIATNEGWISNRMLISDNQIRNTGTAEKYGFDFYDSRGTRSGIHVQTVHNLVISGNIISEMQNEGSGITLSAVNDVLVSDNKISDCSRGIVLDSPAHYAGESRLSPELLKELYPVATKVPEIAGSDNVMLRGNFISRADRDGIYVSGSQQRAVRNLFVSGNFFQDNNRGNYEAVRDFWGDWIENGRISDNFSAGTTSPAGLAPVQGIGTNCTGVVFEEK